MKGLVEGAVYQTSQFVRCLKAPNDQFLVYHTLIGNPTVINGSAKEILDYFSRLRTAGDFLGQFEANRNVERAIAILAQNHFIVQPDDDQREKVLSFEAIISDAASGKNMHVLDLSVSEVCNLGCRYCMHRRALNLNSSRVIGSNGFMSLSLAKRAIQEFRKHLQRNGTANWNLHLGSAEPLLVFDLVKEIVQHLYRIKFIPDDISINSNLSRLTREMVIFFKEYNIRVNTSFDGAPTVNDLVRVFRNGKGTAAHILRGIELVRSVGHHVNGVGVTLCDLNFDLVDDEIIDWLVDHQIPNVLFDIDIVHLVNLDVDLVAEKFVRFERICRERGVRVDGCWKTAYENIRDSGVSGVKSFCYALMGNNLLVAPSGNLYYCTYSGTPIGHIGNFPESLTNGPFRDLLTQSLKADFSECRGCDIEGHCLGGCLLTREGSDRGQKVSQMCRFYRAATEKLLMLDVA